MKRTMKQHWQAERHWELLGALYNTSSRLQQIANFHSVLPEEKQVLLQAAAVIKQIITVHRTKTNDKRSFKQFRERSWQS